MDHKQGDTVYMRAWRTWIVVLAMALGACTAVDDFSRYHFVYDGGAGSDLAGVPDFGGPCTTTCNLFRQLFCFPDFGGKTAPGGICTRTCSSTANCADLPNATCVSIQNTSVCMPKCDAATSCRSGYDCCANRDTTNGPGACAPSNTDFCGHG
jgi:hypothetical protein